MTILGTFSNEPWISPKRHERLWVFETAWHLYERSYRLLWSIATP
jgi:hypothetical protein